MNIVLFHPTEVDLPLSRYDPRAIHILGVLRRQAGGTFDAGLIDGPRGRGTLVTIGEDTVTLAFTWSEPPPPLAGIHLLIGLPRPQTARDILRDMTSMGVAAMHFIRSEKGEASYADSNLWKSDEWKECLIKGAAQAFCTRLPEITCGRPLNDALALLPVDSHRFALDNYESATALNKCNVTDAKPLVLAIGSERGWSAGERNLLRASGFVFASLGPRVLRTEIACVAAVTLLKAKLGLL